MLGLIQKSPGYTLPPDVKPVNGNRPFAITGHPQADLKFHQQGGVWPLFFFLS